MARLAAWRRVIVFSKACWLECQGLCSPCHGVRVWVCIARPLTISNLFAVGTTTFACLSCISKLVWSGRVFRSIYPVSNNLKVTHTLCAFNLCSLSSFISSPRLFLAENGDWLVFLSIVSQRVHLRSMLASDFQCELHSLLLAWCPVAGKSKSSGPSCFTFAPTKRNRRVLPNIFSGQTFNEFHWNWYLFEQNLTWFAVSICGTSRISCFENGVATLYYRIKQDKVAHLDVPTIYFPPSYLAYLVIARVLLFHKNFLVCMARLSVQ